MRKDNFGQIWLLAEKGLSKLYPGESKESKNFRFANYSWEKPDFFSSKENIPIAFLQDNRGDFWFAIDGNGIFRMTVDEMNYSLKTVDHFFEKNGLPTNKLWSIIQDYEGNLWIGTDVCGVTRFQGKMFETFSKEDGLTDNTVLSVTQTKDGKFWIGSYTGGVNIYDPSAEPTQRFSVFHFPKSMDMSSVQGITEDSEGNVWFTGDMGAVQYNTKNGSGDKAYRLFTTPDTISYYKHTNKIIEDKQKNIWVSCTYRGLQKLTPDPVSPLGYKRKFITYKDGMVKAPVRDFIIDHNGDIWSATSKGLSHVIFKGDTSKPEIHKITKETGLPCEYILAVFEDRKNNIWLGTKEGAIKIVRNPDELNKTREVSKYVFKNFTTSEGLSSDLIFLINEDQEGNIWFGTNKGVDQYLIDRGTFRNYGKEEGFSGIETNLKATCKDRNGNLWFGTIKGLIKYNTNEAFPNLKEPNTTINRLRIYFKDVEIPADHTFNYDQNYMTFDFTAICLTNPTKVLYQYKLEGFDKEWSPVSKETNCTYSNLSQGEYTFMVKACNNEGLWNKEPTKYSFTILPPFYKTWWFYSLTIITGLGLIFWFIRFRTRKLERAKRILEVKVKIRTVELSIQKKMVEEKNKNIIDSIEYAQKIQQAMLPEADGLKNILHESFILYQPKDIVSGDFYWFAKIPSGHTFIVVADCTGHGVPGALMSVLGCELLNQIVYEKKIYSTG